MPTFEEIQVLVAEAEKQASTAVEGWIPEKEGDNTSGECVALGTIHTVFGDYYTTTHKLLTEEGYDESRYIRVAWMGAVLQAQYLRLRPRPGDILAFHHQGMETPKTPGLKDYANIVAVVIDPVTMRSRIPVDLPAAPVAPPSAEMSNVNPVTGEVPPPPVQVGRNPLEPIPGEEPL